MLYKELELDKWYYTFVSKIMSGKAVRFIKTRKDFYFLD